MSRHIRVAIGRAARKHAWQAVATVALLASLLVMSSPVGASDAVLEWNQIAFAATVTAAQGPLPQTRSMTIVQISMHDSVNGVTGDYRTYFSIGAAPWGASAEAAAIAAAHRALVGLFPAQASALNAARATSLAAHELTDTDPGIVFGEFVAAAVLSARSSDGSAQAQFAYIAAGAGAPGVWTPVGADQALLPGWRHVKPWVLQDATQFAPADPPILQGKRYARDYTEVQEVGSLTSATRTAEQTEIARFWLATPASIWNDVARQVIQARKLDLSATARAFALVYLATADAGITCWNAKYAFNVWRPITAIRNGDLDGNDRTVADPDWAPLFPTPQHPEYVSGHSTNSSAMATMLTLLFGDDPDVAIVASSPTNPGFQRHWATFNEGIDEVIDARIYSGAHYRTSNEEGARLGREIARFVMEHALGSSKGSAKEGAGYGDRTR